jgi:predicted nucleotidyltransferase component of viral defense system
MEILKSPHWEVVSPEMRQLLTALGQQSFLSNFYLAGGTGLSLQIGHRRSVDFDFFSETDEVTEKRAEEITRSLNSFSIQVIERTLGNLVFLADNIRIGFFGYGYPLIHSTMELENVALASIADIGLMKCDALITRGSRKDFYDLFYIARSIPLSDLLQLGSKKYTQFRDFPLLVLESMTLFDNADLDFQPLLYDRIAWEEVKSFFMQQAKILAAIWFK